MIRALVFVCVLVAAIAYPRAVNATACTVPNLVVNGQYVDATKLAANFSALAACSGNIDNSNIGAAGIYASQIIPATVAQAIFGGSVSYTFPSGLTVTGILQAMSGIEIGGFEIAMTSNASGFVPASSSQPITFVNAADNTVNVTFPDAGGITINRGSLSAPGASFTGPISGTSASFTGASFTGPITGTSASFTGTVQTGALMATANSTITGTLTLGGALAASGATFSQLVAGNAFNGTSFTDSSLTANQCVQTSTGGTLATTGAACASPTKYSVNTTMSACAQYTACVSAASQPLSISGNPSSTGNCYAMETSGVYTVIPSVSYSSISPAGYYLIIFNAQPVAIPNGTAITIGITCQ